MTHEITQEMRDHFKARTKRHIRCVQRNIEHLAEALGNPPFMRSLEQRLGAHDLSKYREPELTPYIWITWKYKCQRDGVPFSPPADLEESMHLATFHHVRNNQHHPEFWDDTTAMNPRETINPTNRDAKPTRMIDGKGMPKSAIAEMVCDWHSVALERNGTDALAWAEANVNERWEFDYEQTELIYECVDALKDQTVFVEGQ